MKIIAAIWVIIVFAAIIWGALKYTDRHFWRGAGIGALLTVGAVITGLAIGYLIP